MEKNAFGERFILISEGKKYTEIAGQVRSKLRLKDAKIMSKSLLNFGRILNILFGWLFPPLRMITKTNIDAITSMTVISNHKIKEKLNYQFIPIKESIAFHLNNYINDKKLNIK